MKLDRLTIIMTSCKWYDDILDIHEQLWEKHWPDCPYKRILVMEEATEGAAYLEKYDEVLITGKETGKENHRRVQEALKKVTTPYVIFIQEDMLLFDKVDTNRIESLIDVMDKDNEVGYIRLTPLGLDDKEKYPKYDKAEDLYQYTEEAPYRISYSPSIWRTEFLTEMSAPFVFGADFERKGTEYAKGRKEKMLGYQYSAYPYINVIRRGKWEIWAANQVLYYGIHPDFNRHKLMDHKDTLKQSVIGYIYNSNPNRVLKIQRMFKIGKTY